MKLFSFITKDRLIHIGIRWEDITYDFSYIWDMFKDIKGHHRFPEMTFIQVMIEFGFFNYDDITEVITTVKKFRSLHDLIIHEPIQYDVPISRPQKIICLGRNYQKHAEEFNQPVPDEPIIFAKMPSTLTPYQGAIILPNGVGRVDHEAELAVVVSRTGKNIPVSKAYDYVAGYTIMNDVTARALQKSDVEKRLPWMRSKSFDTFGPIGPFLVPHGAIPNPHELNITLKVNDDVRQQANTSQMVFKIPQIIEFVSKHFTLHPGDIIATGTPEGVSELRPGDTVTIEIERIGTLQNRVVAE